MLPVQPVTDKDTRGAGVVKIVIATSNPQDREQFSAAVAAVGYAPHAVGTGEAALEIVLQGSALAVVTDLHLQDMTGIELLRAAQTADQGVVGIVLCARDQILELLEAATRVNIFRQLPLPCSPAFLAQTVLDAVAAPGGEENDTDGEEIWEIDEEDIEDITEEISMELLRVWRDDRKDTKPDNGH